MSAKSKQSFSLKKIILALGLGIVLTLVSMSVSGFNLKIYDSYEGSINDIDNCAIETLIDTNIKITERGFPYSYIIQLDKPYCENYDQVNIVHEFSFEYIAGFANLISWTGLALFGVVIYPRFYKKNETKA